MPIPQAAHYINCPLHELPIIGVLLRRERDVSQGQARNNLLNVVMLNINSTRGEIWQDYNAAENVLSSLSSVAFISLMLVSWNMAWMEIILVMYIWGRSRTSFLLRLEFSKLNFHPR